jgi:hypothetical protein
MKDIITGAMNSALNKESALSLKRLEICRDCKL